MDVSGVNFTKFYDVLGHVLNQKMIVTKNWAVFELRYVDS